MRVRPAWPVAFGVYAVYNAIIFATWAAVGADYRDLTSEDVVASRLVLPLALGAIFVVAAVSRLGWWKPVLAEPTRAAPRWALVVVVAGVAGFVVATAVAVSWSALSPSHVLMLAAGGVLVGFNEETVARGVLVTGLRGSTRSETRVWFWSSLLFGAMHLPNALFGLPPTGALVQCLFAGLTGGAFYVARRGGGTLVLPMLMHGAWDFVSFGSHVGHAQSDRATLFQFATYAAATVAVVAVLVRDRAALRAADADRDDADAEHDDQRLDVHQHR